MRRRNSSATFVATVEIEGYRGVVLRVWLVGGPKLSLGDEPLQLPERRAARSLLAWLALHPGDHQRSKVAAMLWPDVLDESARASLRVVLSALRRTLGPDTDRYLATTREEVGLTGDDVWVDAREFTRLIESGDLKQAAALGYGELLPGLDDDWAYAARDEHRLREAVVLARLAQQAESDGDLAAAIDWNRRQLGFDPLAEDAARELMRRLAAAGDRPGALRVYNRLQQQLRQELGLAPSPATRGVAGLVRDRADDPRDASARHRHAAPPGGVVTFLFTDLVGSTELAQAVGDDASEQLFKRHLATLREAIATGGGYEVKQMGDGLMAAFASPAAAVASAIAMQQAVARDSARAEYPLEVRIGLDVGDAMEEGGDYWGTPIVVARRLCDSAGGGQILVSETVRQLVGSRGGHEFSQLGQMELKGLADPVPARKVVWHERSSPGEGIPSPLAAADRRGFVGRSAPLAQLEALLPDGQESGWTLALVSGEPGIGKTRIAAKLARVAADRGTSVLFGRCYEEALTPYQPFVEALERYIGNRSPDVLRQQLGSLAGDLRRLLPSLEDPHVQLPTARLGDPDGERYRLFSAVAALLGSARTPILLVLDDLHWADEPTVLMLKHVLRAPSDASGLIVVTYRDSELPEDHAFARVIGDLARERALNPIELDGLDEEAVSELVNDWEGNAPSDLSVAIHRETDGNPFFIEELLRHLSERGNARGNGSALPPLHELGVPEGVQRVIERRVMGLRDDAKRVLRLAAVIGREFDFSVLEAISDLSAEALLDAIDDLLAAHLIAEEPAKFGSYSFSHALIRDALYDDMTAIRRARLHRRIGESIEALFAQDLAPRLPELAHHFVKGAAVGPDERGIEYSRRAGEQAADKSAYEEAAAHFERALAVLEAMPAPDAARRSDLLRAAAGARLRAGHLDQSRSLFQRAAAEARRLNDSERLAAAALGHAGGLSAFGIVAVDEPTIALVEEALRRVHEKDSILRARLLATLPIATYFTAPVSTRSELSREAVEMSVRLGDRATELFALTARHWATLGPDGIDERKAAADRIVELASETQDLEMAFRGYMFQAGTLLELGDRAAFAAVDCCEDLATTLRQPNFVWENQLQQAMRALLEARIGDAEGLATSAATSATELGQAPRAMNHYASLMISIRWLQGRLVELEGAVEAFAAQYPWISTWPLVPPFIADQAGRRDEARSALDAILEEGVEQFPRDRSWLLNMAALSLLCHSLNAEPSQVAPVHALLEPFAGRMIVAGGGSLCLGSVELYLGLLAERLKLGEEASERYSRAVVTNEAFGAPAFQALAEHFSAQFLQSHGATAEASELFRSARTRFPGLNFHAR